MIDITKATKAVTRWASKDETRKNLGTVLFDGAMGLQVATNGHGLAMLHQEPCDPKDYPAWDGFVPATENGSRTMLAADAVDDIVKQVPKTARIPVFQHAIAAEGQNGHVRIGIADKQQTVTVPTMEDAQFPDYQQVIPESGKTLVRFGIDARYLKMVAESVMDLDARKDRPIMVTVEVPAPVCAETGCGEAANHPDHDSCGDGEDCDEHHAFKPQVSAPLRFIREAPDGTTLVVIVMPVRF